MSESFFIRVFTGPKDKKIEILLIMIYDMCGIDPSCGLRPCRGDAEIRGKISTVTKAFFWSTTFIFTDRKGDLSLPAGRLHRLS